MTTVLLICAGVLVVLALVYAVAQIAKAQGEGQALRKQAEADLDVQKKAGAVIAEHRTVDDAAGRLQRGDF